MKNFTDYLQRAIRTNSGSSSTTGVVAINTGTSTNTNAISNATAMPTDPGDTDWSPYYVDYPMLKARLISYLKRRMKLAELIRDGDRVYLTEEDLRLVLAVGSTTTGEEGGQQHDAGGNDDVGDGTLLAMMGGAESRTGGIADAVAKRMAACGRCDDYFQYVDGDEIDRSSIRVAPSDATARLSRIERSSFTRLLDNEVERTATFYSTQLVHLAQSIAALEEGSDNKDGNNAETSGVDPRVRFAEIQQQYKHVGNEMLELLAFVVTNIICLRQILIRYDAFVRTFDGMPLSQWYLQQKVGLDHDPLAGPTTSIGGISRDHIADMFYLEALTALEDTYASKMRAVYALYEERIRHMDSEGAAGMGMDTVEQGSAGVESPSLTYLNEFTSQADQFRQLLDKTSESIVRAAGGSIVMRDRFVHGMRIIRYYFLLGSGFRGLTLEPKLLLMRGRHLKKEMRSVARWRETRYLTVEEEDAAKKLDPKNVLPLLLNMLACFLYMMNNYIIEPSSAYYAESLGSSDAMSGMMIGMSPWCALISSVVYSVWTNHSYRQPMIFACILTTVGNLLYASAGSFNSMTICLIGRALTGLGATRIINRRYIADATPFAFRTAASAAFSLVTALGAALGPALAVVLDFFEFEFYLPLLGKQEFNGTTGPGFFMALMWLLFTICVAIVFNEPSRSGLDELRMRETAAAAESSGPSPLRDSSASNIRCDMSNTKTKVDDLEKECIEAAKENVSSGNSITHCFRHVTRPVVLTMSLIFMKRIALESIVGSTSVVTKNRFGWSIRNVGTLHFVNGMIVIPISILSGWLSQFYQDRYLALSLMCITLIGMLCLIDVTDFISTETETYNEGHPLAVGPIRYISGSLVAFSGIEACESFVASLMSKLVPSALAVGTFNSGLLTTLVGTSGRATGDLLITALGSLSIRNLLNLLIVPSTGLVITSIVLVLRNYDALAV